MSKVRKIIGLISKLSPIMLAVTLGACSNQGWKQNDTYIPVSHTERFPIDVVKGTVKLNVSTRSSRLSTAQSDTITRFAQQAQSSGARQVYIRRPAASVNADVIAGRITQIFTEQGINGKRLLHSTISGARGAPVSLSFVRKFAKTRECGNWTKDFSETSENRPHADFGCSNQHNLAAQVANPQDFVTPRTSTPADAMRRHRVFNDYRTPKSTSTPEDSNSKVSTTDSGKTE